MPTFDEDKLVCTTCGVPVTGIALDKDNRFSCGLHTRESATLCVEGACRVRRVSTVSRLCARHHRHQRLARVVANDQAVAALYTANPIVGWSTDATEPRVLLARHADGQVGPERITGLAGAPPPTSEGELSGSVVVDMRELRDASPPEVDLVADAPADQGRALEALAAFDAVHYYGTETIELLVAANESTLDRDVAHASLADAAHAHALFGQLPLVVQVALLKAMKASATGGAIRDLAIASLTERA